MSSDTVAPQIDAETVMALLKDNRRLLHIPVDDSDANIKVFVKYAYQANRDKEIVRIEIIYDPVTNPRYLADDGKQK